MPSSASGVGGADVPAGSPAPPAGAPASSQGQRGGGPAGRVKPPQTGEAGKSSDSALPVWKPYPAGVTAPTIPLITGLAIVTAISGGDGDYESIKRVLDVNKTDMRLAYSADVPPSKSNPLLALLPQDSGASNGERQSISGVRIVDIADLQTAHGYDHAFSNQTEHIPGTTAITASTEVLNALRAGQEVEFHLLSTDPLLPLAQLLGEQSSGPRVSIFAGKPMFTCSLHRVEPGDVSVPVLANDQRVELPAVHAMCPIGDKEAHFYYLDQPSQPLTLAFQLGPIDTRLQVIQITVPATKKVPTDAAPAMERALEEKKPVEVYSLYFDFNQATIKLESEPVLKQIADILAKHDDWALDIGGHTDSVGGDAFNLDLSRRRAAAVKEALVSRYHIPADRLATNGCGASMPIETNATMEGRARNRRVELRRQ